VNRATKTMAFKRLKYFSILFCLLIFLQETHCYILHELEQEQSKTIKSDENGDHASKALRRIDEEEDQDDATLNDDATNDVELYHKESSSKRSLAAWVTAAKIGYTGLSGLTVVGGVATLGVAARLEDVGCCDSYDLCDDEPEFQRLYDLLGKKSKEIDQLFLEGENRLANAIELSRMCQKLYDSTTTFEFSSSILFDEIDSELENKFTNMSLEITNAISAGNATLEEFSELELKFAGVFLSPWDYVFHGLGFVFSMSYPFMAKAQYMKIKVWAQEYQVQQLSIPKPVVATTNTANPNHNPLVASKGVAKVNGFTNFQIKNHITWTNVGKFCLFLVAAAGIAMTAYGIYAMFDSCKSAEKTASDYLVKVKAAHIDADELLINATVFYNETHASYDDMYATLTEVGFLDYCNNVAQLLGNASVQTQDVIDAREGVEEYIKDALNPDLNVHEFYNLTKKLLVGFNGVTHQMFCLTKKVEEYYKGRLDCSNGEYALEDLYYNMSTRNYETINCTDTGYWSWEDFKVNIEADMIRTGKQIDCILNDYKLQLGVCDAWYTGSNHEYTITAVQEDYFISVCPPGDGSGEQIKNTICNNKYEGKDKATVVQLNFKYLSSDVTEAFDQCPFKLLTDNDIATICLLKAGGNSIDKVKSYYEYNDAADVTTAYDECPDIVWDALDLFALCMLQAGSIARDSDPAVALDETYGKEVVDQKLLDHKCE